MGGPNSLSDRNPAKTHVFTNSCSEPKKVESDFASWENVKELVETGGMVFPDGSCIELIKDADGSLSLLDSRSNESLQRIKVAGQEYIPPTLEPSTVQAVTLPSKRIDCGLTVELFTQIYSCLLDFGVSEEAALVSTYFAFASWFPEFLSVAPCLIITGTAAEARIVLELLACVVRHALPLVEIKAATFHRLPILIQPILLIGYIHPQAWRIFFASNNPRTYLANRNGLTDLYSVKAVYAGSTLGEFGGDAILNIHCTPNDGKLPDTTDGTLEKIAAYFQPRLLDYRLKHIVRVRVRIPMKVIGVPG